MKKLKDYTYLSLKNYSIKSLSIKSSALKGNPLGDPSVRHNPVLVPNDGKPEGIVFILAGFTGNGPNFLSLRPFESNYAETIDQLTSKDAIPKAYVFVDAWTAFGGSQFLNSSAVGKYEDYIVKELLKEAKKVFGESLPVAICGHSSGGYGAIYLATKYPKQFPYMMALAPDSFFEINFLKDTYESANFLKNYDQKDYLKKLKTGELSKYKDFHPICASVAMSACYAPRGAKFDFPIDCYTGKLNEKVWKKCLEKDPLYFLPKRLGNTKKLAGIFLEVGNKDQFHLHLGARQIHQLWKKNKIHNLYNEFDGGHFDLSSRREGMLAWLQKAWKDDF
jgi:S-formylglutathione hydrolase FrmB